MKDYFAYLVQSVPAQAQRRNLMREYLQARILGTLQHAGAMVPLAFQGGTALRFLYAIPRYSEDLDFSLEQARSAYDFRGYVQAIKAVFEAEGYMLEIRLNEQRVVQHALIRFPGLPYELGLSPMRSEIFMVKIEVDTNPPAGAGLETSLVRRHVPLQLQHYDKPSLLAGKLHAILQRSYFKGRDMYDLLWYLSDPAWPAPNLLFLNNALKQSGWTGGAVTEQNWRGLVRERLQQFSWEQATTDVLPFLESSADTSLLTRENLLRVLG